MAGLGSHSSFSRAPYSRLLRIVSMNAADTLWVCYQAVELDDAEAAVLSFMSPFDEEEFVQKHRGRFVQARELSTQVRGEARDIYFSIVSSIGTSRTRTGATFRQALSTNQNASRWWYHPTSFRDAES